MRGLEVEDRAIIDFYRTVGDQVVNLFPMAEKAYLAPRLEGWLAGCELLGIAEGDRARVVALARELHEGVHGRRVADRLAAQEAAPEQLRPPEPPE